jgi:pyruvate/2-oxoglutarate dehydrogenase complex dihydrolipoamide acyltransferase (E2) component
MAGDTPRWESQRYPSERRIVAGAVRAGRRRAPIHGLIQVDVTEAWERLNAMSPRGSFTAFVVACVGRAAAGHPAVHAYRDWRGRVVTHRQVDVATLVEVPAPGGGTFPLAHVLRSADTRTVGDLTAELRDVKANPGQAKTGRWLHRASRALRWLPGATRLAFWGMERSKRLRSRTGTVAVTSVGMFGGGGGHGIGFPTVASLSVLVGGASLRPWLIAGEIIPRRVLDLTITVDHVVVDGGPAARFGAALRELLETAAPLD